MTAVAFAPVHRQLFKPVYPVHETRTVRRALWNRYIKWIETAPIATTLARFSCFCVMLFLTFEPGWTKEAALFLLTWNGYKIPLFCAGCALLLNARRLYKLARRLRVSSASSSNQHTYRGIPIDELATYLFEQRAFKHDDAIDRLRISHEKQIAIGNELLDCGVLRRGDKNARVLNETITREQMVGQLEALAAGKKTPLVFDSERKEWVARDSGWHLHLQDKDRQEQARQKYVRGWERRAKRAKETVSAFKRIMAGEFTYSPETPEIQA